MNIGVYHFVSRTKTTDKIATILHKQAILRLGQCTRLETREGMPLRENGGLLQNKINIHRSDVRLKKDTAVATHFKSGSCRATHLSVLYLEVLKNTGDITLTKIGRLDVERK